MSDLHSASTLFRPSPDHPAGGAGTDGSIGRRPRAYTAAALLVLLQERTGHGWELVGRLREVGVSVPDNASLYRVLRQMEDEGLVASHWDHSDQGPARRIYAISGPGADRLQGLASELADQQRSIALLLRRYRRDRNPLPRALKAV